MLFSVSNDGFEWSLDFGLDSVTLTVKKFAQKKTKSSQENPPSAWNLLPQRREVLNNHLAQLPVTLKPAMDNGDEGRSIFECRFTGKRHKRVSGVRSGRYRA